MIDTPYFELLYNNKNATHDIAKDMLSVTYTDTIKGESDELEITLDDSDRKWMDSWYPSQGATLKLKLGKLGQPLLDAGSFEIDEIDVSDSPNTVRIRALSAGINIPARTKRFVAYENKTLSSIVNQVAQNLGYKVEGQIEDVTIERMSQRESDLTFLGRIAKEYGYVFKVKGKTLVFSSLKMLRDNKARLTLHRTELKLGWSFSEQIRTVKKQVIVNKHNAKTKKLVQARKQAKGKTASDSLVVRSNSANDQTAQVRANAELQKSNHRRATGRFAIDGNVLIIAGANFDLQGFKRFDGKCLIEKARHTISRQSGYSTDVDFVRLIKA